MSVRTLRYNTMNQHITKSALASTDRDALAFLEAAQIYNTNQQRAIVNLVRSLKRVGLWSKMKAIYPFVGGTATSHKFNLKDPRDADAAFRLTFSGGWTHSSTGADPNGTNGYADTLLIPSTNLTQNTTHLSLYLRENLQEASSDIGALGTGTSRLLINARWIDGIHYTDQYNFSTNRIATALSDCRGLLISSRTTSTSFKAYRNGLQIGSTNTSSSSGFSTIGNSVVISGTTGNFSSKEVAFATIGDGLTDTDATNLYNIVDLYQRRLGRNV